MEWSILLFIGTVSFSFSGAIIAIEEEYDLFGVLTLSFVTVFGGGIIRNIMMGVSNGDFWSQGQSLQIAIIATLIIFISPRNWIHQWRKYEVVFDAIGLASFSIYGALEALNRGFSMSAIIFAAMITGVGGGIIRDILAGRKPIVLREEVYAAWAGLAGIICSTQIITTPWSKIMLVILIVSLRLISFRFKWKVPRRTLSDR